MRWRRSNRASERNDPRLGLDTVSFDTFGWDPQSSHDDHRVWFGEHDGLHLAMIESFSPGQPWFSSLDPKALRDEYERMRAVDPASGKDRVVEISSDPRVPTVRMLVRVPDPEGNHYAIWSGYVMVPLAQYGWVITIQAQDRGVLIPGETFGQDEDMPTTGVREALAFNAWSKENLGPETDNETFDARVAHFDPYDRRWDDIVPGHQLSTVRSYLDRLQASVHFRPEFYDQTPFRGAAGNSRAD
jgi:hypothetical protein